MRVQCAAHHQRGKAMENLIGICALCAFIYVVCVEMFRSRNVGFIEFLKHSEHQTD